MSKSPKNLKLIDKIDKETSFSLCVKSYGKGEKMNETITDFKNV